jgi:hypothetical protein
VLIDADEVLALLVVLPNAGALVDDRAERAQNFVCEVALPDAGIVQGLRLSAVAGHRLWALMSPYEVVA